MKGILSKPNTVCVKLCIKAGRSATRIVASDSFFDWDSLKTAVLFHLMKSHKEIPLCREVHARNKERSENENMKKIKSYTGIWNVEKVLYAINDFNLPFPVTFTQITWFVITEFIIILFGDLPPLSMVEGAFLKYFGIPVALTWFMSQKTFDGKKPYSFLKSQITFALRPKTTYAGKAVKLDKQVLQENITTVRSVSYVPD